MMLILTSLAWATCRYEQAAVDGGVQVTVAAVAEPVGCRTLTLSGPAPLAVTAERVAPDGSRWRLGADRVVPAPGGVVKVGAPDLRVGDTLRATVRTAEGPVTVALTDSPDPVPRGAWVEETWEVALDPKHPGWGFADPSRGETRVTLSARSFEDSPDQVLPVPVAVEGLVATRDGAPLATWPGAVPLAAGAAVEARWTVPGAPPLGRRELPPGSFTLRIPGAELVTAASDGVTVREVPGGVRFDAPAGGVARWRVVRVGPEPVVSDAELYARGLDWRFARVSLPEPAVPVRLASLLDPTFPLQLLSQGDPRTEMEALFLVVRALVDARLPGTDPLRPRPLNRAWKSGWVSAVERGLVLQRFLAQEKIPAAWVLTGIDADPVTLTGYDHVLVVAEVAGERVWLDPACRACAPGEWTPDLGGRPALGGADRVPRRPGALVRRQEGDAVTVTATGEAARWASGEDPVALARRLGVVGATGVTVARDPDGTLRFAATVARLGPLPFAEPPWDGPAEDVVAGPVAPAPPAEPAPPMAPAPAAH